MPMLRTHAYSIRARLVACCALELRARLFCPAYGQLLSLAVQWGVAIEIERAVKTSARFC